MGHVELRSEGLGRFHEVVRMRRGDDGGNGEGEKGECLVVYMRVTKRRGRGKGRGIHNHHHHHHHHHLSFPISPPSLPLPN